MNPCSVESDLRPAALCFSLGLLSLLAGCGKNLRSAEHAVVSGTVRFHGNPLPGGRITFIAVNGGFTSTEIIEENGAYRIRAPVGEVEISVTNRMLQPSSGPKGPARLSKAAAEENQIVKGRWVEIPSRYEDPHSSGLRYTVKRGAQVHDIELTNEANSR